MPGRGWRRIDPHWVTILALPLAVVAVDPNLVFPSLGFVDTWVYLGYFRHLAEFSGKLFRGLYFANRLSWLMPGALLHRTLPPLAANYVLHLAVAYVAAIAFYIAIRRLASRGVALVGGIALLTNPFFWHAVGEDYVDGFGVAVYCVMLALIASERLSRPAAITVGVLWLALVDSNLVWAGFTPALLAVYLRMRRERPWRDLLCALAGATVAAAGLSLVSHALWGDWWFYRSTLSFASGGLERPNDYKLPGYTWMLRAPWLAHAGLAALLCLASMLSARKRPATAQIHFWLCLAPLAIVELKGLYFLDYPFYASFLIPAALLAIVAILPLRALVPLVAMNAALFVANGDWATLRQGRLTLHNAYDRVTLAAAAVDHARGVSRPVFWYSKDDPNAAELDALSSEYLWVYTLAGHDYPQSILPDKLKPGSMLVVPTSSDSPESTLRAAQKQLRPLGLIPHAEGSVRLDRYTLNYFALARASSDSR